MRGTPFLSHWKSGVSVTPLGREREQVRVTVAPAMTGDEGEELSEMVTGAVMEDRYSYCNYNKCEVTHTYSLVWPGNDITRKCVRASHYANVVGSPSH